MSEMKRVVLVIEQVIEHRVTDEVDLEEVRGWLLEGQPPGAPLPQVTGEHVRQWLTAHRDWKDDLYHYLAESTEQEPMDHDLLSVELTP